MTTKDLTVKLVSYTNDPIKTMWLAARNCYYRGDFCSLEHTYKTEDSIEFLKRIYDKGHLSIFEFPNFAFQIENISRSCLAQLTRHRIGFSYAVQSQHFQKYEDFQFKELEQYINEEQKQEYAKLMENINSFYKKALKNGLPKYIAREVLPNSCLNHMMMSSNLRALDNFWKLRSTTNNTPEIINLSNQLYTVVTDKIPEISSIIPYFRTKFKEKEDQNGR
jgi:thymidylate synthase (FAD)